jgi:hypothetical protein
MATFESQQKPALNTPATAETCFRCGAKNVNVQSFCGVCGSPLSLQEYISKQVSENLVATIRDRDVLESESSIRVFERAWC